MQTTTVLLLACLASMAYAKALEPAVDSLDLVEHLESVHETAQDLPAEERGTRSKRGLLLLKKKLLLGALGLKAAKVGVVGGAVAGAAALAAKKHKAKSIVVAPHGYGYSSHGPSWNVEVHSWH